MNALMTSWRPAQVSLASAIGQGPAPLPLKKTALIDSPVASVLLDALIVVGSTTIAIGYAKDAQTNPQAKARNLKLRNVFLGLSVLGTIKFVLDAGRNS